MKAYRFYSDPGRIVNDGISGRRLFVFDEKGEYITLDPIIANRMKPHFRNEEIELVEKSKVESSQEPAKEPAKFKCKKCTYETDNKGELLAHYRETHPREG